MTDYWGSLGFEGWAWLSAAEAARWMAQGFIVRLADANELDRGGDGCG